MKIAPSLTLWLLTAAFASAQLGESEEKCAAFLGKPMPAAKPDASGVKIVKYRTPAFQVTAGFKAGDAAYFIYRKNDGSSMSDAEVQSILTTHSTEQMRWSKKIITGERRPVIQSGSRLKSPFHDEQHGPREWQVFGHDEFYASYFFEKYVLVIGNSKSGLDATSALKANRL